MLVNALSPHVGCEEASATVHEADEGATLKAAALVTGVSEDEFDRIVDPSKVDPSKMVGDPQRDLGPGPLASGTTT